MSATKRSGKTTPRQYATMVDFISRNKKMLNAKLTPDFTSNDKEELWENLAQLLNADGLGPIKSVEKWKKTWADYKSVVKTKVADNRRKRRKTGGGPPPEDLPLLYEKTAEIIGEILIEGDKNIEETGRRKNECATFEVDGSQVLKQNKTEEEQSIDDDTSYIMSGQVINEILEDFGTPSGHQQSTEMYSQTPVRPAKNSHKRKLNEDTFNLNGLIEEEAKKSQAINNLAEAIERSNEIMRERNAIENDRNLIFESAANNLLHMFNQLINKT